MTLPDYIASHLSKPFKWGEQDCMHFACGWVERVTGRDLLVPYRPWASTRQAMRKIRQVGGLVAFFDTHFKRIEPNLAHDGDLTVIRDSAALFSGAQVVSVGETGLVFIDRTEALCAWRF
jgi:hypothetical protein